MAKRLTDTEIWEQDWYIDLPNKYKLLWNFIKDKCDDCGVWRPNKSLLQKIIGEPINLDEFLNFVNIGQKERIRVLNNGRWFLIEYFFFQYGDKFNPKSPVHRGALKRLLQNNIHPKELQYLHIGDLINIELQQLKEIGYQKGSDSILKAYGNSINRDKDKDKDKDKVKAKDNIINLENENENEIVLGEIGSEKIREIANEVWKDQIWKEQICMGLSISMEELKKWLAQFNSSIASDNIPGFNSSKYKKMSRGWITAQKSKGVKVETGNQRISSAPTLTYLKPI